MTDGLQDLMGSDDFRHARWDIFVGVFPLPLLQDRYSKIGRASDIMKDRIIAPMAFGGTIDIEIENGILHRV